MDRRNFLGKLAGATALSAAAPSRSLNAQKGPPQADPVEKDTTAPTPTIALNHLGFRPRAGRKVLVVRATTEPTPAEYELRDVVPPFRFRRPLERTESDFGAFLTADFTDLERPGIYQITAGGEQSVPFFIRDDVWRRTLKRSVGYYRYQRCGVEVPGVHAVCHLDDARRRDTGEHVDTVGGWHDAGDVRKWMDATMLNAFALLCVARNLPAPRAEDPQLDEVLAEFRHGNLYFLKMQDTDGRIWHDVAGGVNGDNSDNHWTDNVTGTSDDRYLNTRKQESISAMFAALQAMAAQAFREIEPDYARLCLDAATRAWQGSPRKGSTLDAAWWAVAACELRRATGKPIYGDEALRLGRELLSRQNTTFAAGQRAVRGYWTESPAASASRPDSPALAPYFNVVYPALPALALLDLCETFPAAADRGKWKDAVRLHLDEFVLPMASRNAYRLIPSGLYLARPTPEAYRPLAGELTYRYFMPVKKQFWWQGINSHLGCYALLLGRFARLEHEEGGDSRQYSDLAYRQLEWIMGANPFGACLMTGEGMRNPYPHSRFVGLIPGGIMNGIAGNAEDQPVLDQAYAMDWRTCEYWSPHVAYYLLAVSTLEPAVKATTSSPPRAMP
jgi:Glycosyl hydrolase family 9/Cellulase N-terminal ig-like domain